MSSYPPHHYGTSYNFHDYTTPSAGTYNDALSQYNQVQTQAPYVHAQAQANGVSPTPHVNAYSFSHNGQGITRPGSGVNQGHLGYGSQPYPRTLPPPPFPPVPINVGTSHFPQTPNQTSPFSNNPSIHAYPPSENLNPQSLGKSQNSGTKDLKNAIPAASDLEDGEVNDGESEKPLSDSEANKMGTSFSRARGSGPNREHGLTNGSLSNGHTNITHRISSGQMQDPHLEYDNHPLTSYHPQQSPKPNGISNISNNLTPTRSAADLSNEYLPSKDTIEVIALSNIETIARKKEDAQRALLDLHSHGHDFNNIVKEGMDPTVLRMLYAAVNLPIDSSPSSQLQRELEVNARRASMSNAPIADGKFQARGGDIDRVTQDRKSSDSTGISPTIATTKEKSSVTSSATTFAPKKTLMSTPSVKIAGAKAADPKTLDRKEYIARMLAAKAGKTIASAGPSIPPKLAAVVTSQPEAPSPTSDSVAVPSTFAVAPLTQPTNHSLRDELPTEIPQSTMDDQNVSAKRIAQTELARQKMEALKSQRETAKAISSSDPATQSSSSSPAQATYPPTVAPVMITQLSNPTRQGSYFSPVSQRAPFSIPGLFMTSTPLDTVKPLQIGPAQSSLASTQKQQAHSSPAAALRPARSASEAKLLSEPIPDMENAAVLTHKTAPALTHRKRQKAADFLDSPSTRIKRPLGQQEDSSVIIDISDEEMVDFSDSSDLDPDSTEARENNFKNIRIDDLRRSKQKSIRDLPPLSDFPSRKKAPQMTPPIAPMPNHTKDSKGLKSKEMEIEQMNRKIAELEQRISAKKITSRAATPGSSGNTRTSPADKDSPPVVEAVPVATEDPEAPDGHSNDSRFRQSYFPAVDHADTEEAEQKLHEVERAKASVERSLAADIARASNEQQLLQEELLQSVQDEMHSTLPEAPEYVNELEHVQTQPVEGRHLNIQQGDQDQNAEVSQLKEIDTDFKEQEDMEHQRVKQTHLQEEEQRQMRRHALQSGLPVLDATVEKTKQKLECLRKEILDLEMEVQKGIEGRRALVTELESLSQAANAPSSPRKQRSLSISDHAEQYSATAKTEAAAGRPASVDMIGGSEAQEPNLSGIPDTPQKPATNPQQKDAHNSAVIPQATVTTNAHLSEGEVEEDVMDISRSQVDEGELSEYSPKLPNAEILSNGKIVEDKEGYEPQSDSGIVQRPSNLDQVPSDIRTAEIEMPDAGIDLCLTNEQRVWTTHHIHQVDRNADPQHEEHSSHPGLSLADDSDNYEPPEPALSPQALAVELKSPLPPPSIVTGGNVVPVQAEPRPTYDQLTVVPKAIGPAHQMKASSTPTQTNRHFTPYESPLKQFKSYRNHPEYLNEVPSFRSLTYSHTINPGIPICRYELDGVCNDASCESQHFKSLGLSDEKILVDLGATPNDVDATAFTNGLKLLVQDIRSRKVKDVNKVASEITEYRRNFLGENRVISI